jgi:hypothetical protein
MATVETAFKSPSIPFFKGGSHKDAEREQRLSTPPFVEVLRFSVPLFGKEGLGEILRNECHLEPFGALGVNSVRDFFWRKISPLRLEMTDN